MIIGLLALLLPLANPVVPAGAEFEMLHTDVSFAEGAAAGFDGAIYFSDIGRGTQKGRILRFDPKTKQVTVFRADSGKSNGLFFDVQGRLVACEGADYGGRRISRSSGDGPAETLAEGYKGKRFNAPNDLCIDAKGRIWFSDPKYTGHEEMQLDHRSVYRIDPDDSLHRVITQPEIQKPNGVNIGPDQTTLYVADTNSDPGGNMQLTAFRINADGSVSNKRIVHDFAPHKGVDGMTFDSKGNVYAAVRNPDNPAIYVFSPEDELLGKIPLPDVPTNCIFGRGADSHHLYVTMDGGFGRIRLNATGYHVGRKAEG